MSTSQKPTGKKHVHESYTFNGKYQFSPIVGIHLDDVIQSPDKSSCWSI